MALITRFAYAAYRWCNRCVCQLVSMMYGMGEVGKNQVWKVTTPS